jgi:hypothetical protein
LKKTLLPSWQRVLETERLQVDHQTGLDAHYRITVFGGEWERYYIKEEEFGALYQAKAFEIILEVMSR